MVNTVRIMMVSIFIFIGTSGHAQKSLKIAIIDNFKYQKYVTTKYKEYYLKGLVLALSQAKSDGLLMTHKVFQYNQDPLSIITVIPDVIKWNPDVIIGPRDSNKFLMLPLYIKDVLTVSPFATSLAVAKMPPNFFSVTLSDSYEAKAMYNFIKWKFPNKDVIVLTEADCKSCNDVSEEFIQFWLKGKNSRPYHQYYISQQAATLKLGDAIENNNGEKIIVIPNNAHDSAVLMARISQRSSQKTIFVGGDGWGSWEDTEAGKLGDLSHYYAYHIVPWGLESCGKDVENFKKSYEHKFKEKAKNKLSYIIYQTVTSIVSSYAKYGVNLDRTIKDNLLQGYRIAITKNRNWYHSIDYLVYEINSNKNDVYALVNPVTDNNHIYNCKQS